LWWAFFLALGVGSYYAERLVTNIDDRPVLPTGNEREAFLAVTFGKIAEEGTPDVISAATFRDEMRALRGAGYVAVGLDSLEAFYANGRPLPDRPIVLLFDNVQRDSIEIADRVLAEVGYRGVAFADVEAMAQGNIDLISRHRMEQLADSGRWDIGVSACPGDPATPDGTPEATLAAFERARSLVAEWTDHAVRAINCERALDADGSALWRKTLDAAQYRFGFVLANPRLNYVDDSTLELRRVRALKEWTADDLLASLSARMPRRERFVDDFNESAPRPDWIVERAELELGKGTMKVTARQGTSGGILFLGGTDRWSNAEAKATIAGKPDGQVWLSIRSSPAGTVRIGVSHGEVMIQKTEKGETHVYGRRPLPSKPFTIGLEVSGERATGRLDGEPLGNRPVEMPEGAERGPFQIAIWDADGTASVVLDRVEASPTHARCAIVAGVPPLGVWNDLRRESDSLTSLSPRVYSWKDDRGGAIGNIDAALPIFAWHHRLRFLPAVDLELRKEGANWARLEEQLLRWAREPNIDGLNLLVKSELAESGQFRSFVYELRKKARDAHRLIAVTVVGQKGEVAGALRQFGNLYAVDGVGGAFQVAVAPLNLVGAPAS
jgi:hypothetical protein